MNGLDLCIEVISGHVNYRVAFVIEYLGIPGVNSRYVAYTELRHFMLSAN